MRHWVIIRAAGAVTISFMPETKIYVYWKWNGGRDRFQFKVIQNDSAIKYNSKWMNEILMNSNDHHQVLLALMHFLVDEGASFPPSFLSYFFPFLLPSFLSFFLPSFLLSFAFLSSFLPSSQPPSQGSMKLNLAALSNFMEISYERWGIKTGVVRWSLEPSQSWPLTSKHKRHHIASQKLPDRFLIGTGKAAPECRSSWGKVVRRSERLVRLAFLTKSNIDRKKKEKKKGFFF